MILLLWNSRRIRNQGLKIHLRELINYHKPVVIVLTVTKAVGLEADTILSTFNYANASKVDSDGNAGSIYVLWNDQVDIQPATLTEQEIYLFIKVPNLTLSFMLTAVYARPYPHFKKILWDNLASFQASYTGPWLVLGDFNDITNPTEKFGGHSPNKARMNTFNAAINTCNLLGFIGPTFIWSNLLSPHQLIMECLDRFLATPNWLTSFPNAQITHLSRTHSDHYPLLLDTHLQTSKHKKPFKLEAMWLSHPSFDSIVHFAWAPSITDYLYNIPLLTKAISTWNFHSFGNIFNQKKTLQARLVGIQNKYPLTFASPLHALEKTLQADLRTLLDIERHY